MSQILSSKLLCLLLVFGISMLTIADAENTTASADAQKIVSLINTRLEFMTQVANSKAISHLPIEQPKREAEVLDKICKQANERHVNATAIRNLFQEQFTLAKAIQHRYMADFLLGKRLEKTPPIGKIRIQITTLSVKIIDNIADYTQQHGQLTQKNIETLFTTQTPYLSSDEKNKLALLLIESSKPTH